jgi:hypothetical protein
MFLAQAVLLSVPVRITRGRPIARRSLLPTILASGFMMALLAFGAIFALYEFVFTLEADWGALESCATAGVVVLTWTFWSLIFMRLGRAQTPAESVSRQCRALFAGSILELLVAVPTHVVARNRGQCCGGWMTFVGLAAGLSVMVFSFGPSVFFLFAARWRRLHPQAQS